MNERQLIGYLPEIMQEFAELKDIMAVEQREIAEAWNVTDLVLEDQFITTATDHGVSRWESILKINPKAREELEERKFRILTRLNEQLPYTMRTMIQKLNSLCGAGSYSVVLQPNIYTLTVRISTLVADRLKDVQQLLANTIPANIVLTLEVKYNDNSYISNLRHCELAMYTHSKIRSEVLENGKRDIKLSSKATTSRRFL